MFFFAMLKKHFPQACMLFLLKNSIIIIIIPLCNRHLNVEEKNRKENQNRFINVLLTVKMNIYFIDFVYFFFVVDPKAIHPKIHSFLAYIECTRTILTFFNLYTIICLYLGGRFWRKKTTQHKNEK